jgi:hypothetical protein
MARFMVSLILLCFTLVAAAPSETFKLVKRAELGVGCTGKPLPDLFTATLDELQDGLSTGSFSSVDLVKVLFPNLS